MSSITRSERLFKRHCTLRGIDCRRIPRASTQTADYWVTVGSINFAAEVKQVDENANDRRLRDLFDAGDQQPVYGSAIATRVQSLIHSGYPQIKLSAQGAVPAVIVVYNNTRCWWNVIDAFAASRAMFGNFAVGIGLDQKGVVRHTGQSYLGESKTNKTQCRSLSALLVLSGLTEKTTRIEAFHNPFATNPIDPVVLAPLVDAQFRHPAPHRWGTNTWQPDQIG